MLTQIKFDMLQNVAIFHFENFQRKFLVNFARFSNVMEGNFFIILFLIPSVMTG